MDINSSNSSFQNINSLYIPIISSNIDEDFIKKCFNNKNIASINRVDFVFNNNKSRREAFIHINSWNNSKNAIQIINILLSKNNYKFYYDENNEKFWPLLINKNPIILDPSYNISLSNEYILEYRLNMMKECLLTLESIATLNSVNNNHDNKRQRINTEKYSDDFIPPIPIISRQNNLKT